VLDPTRADEALGAGVVVGVPGEPDRGAASEAALSLQAALRDAYPTLRPLAVVLTGSGEGAMAPEAVPVPLPPGERPLLVHTGGGGPQADLPALLEVALAQGAPACALLEPLPRGADPAWLRLLLEPVLTGGVDLVAPAYARGRLEGVLVTGIVYPLTRALFGHRLRQPLGREIVISRRLAEVLLRDEEWRTDPGHAGGDLWVVTKALLAESTVAQVYLGPRPVPRPLPRAQPEDPPALLARILGTIFHEMDVHARRWQRVKGSRPVPSSGEEHLPDPPGAPPSPGPLVAAFGLGWQDLRTLWSAVLPPQTLLALQRIPREPPEAFRVPDVVWVRVIYDFAVAWRVKAMERAQLLRSLTPLYLGWVASFVNEVAALDAAATEARVERLCEAFETEKPYLIARWRWPDRFAP
jgi:hypothetical protein